MERLQIMEAQLMEVQQMKTLQQVNENYNNMN